METVFCGPMAYDAGFPGLKTNMDPKERFYRHFESQATALQEEIANLGNISSTGGERKDATDQVLSGISRLTSEASDASEYAPPRDQMVYGQALKALREQLNIQTRSLGPKSHFQFTQNSKEAFISATNRNVAASRAVVAAADVSDSDIAVQAEATDALGNLPDFPNSTTTTTSSSNDILARDYNAEMAREPGTAIRKPSFSGSREVDISNHRGMHIILPSTSQRATGSGRVTGLRGCILDMSAPAAGGGAPFANLTVRDVEGSLVVAGRVAGAAHVTGVRRSVLVLNARQVRMHQCEDVSVYLWCASHPIIEDCKGVRVAPLPENYLAAGQVNDDGDGGNQWDQVDDFNWLKAEASPNWERLSEKGENSVIPADFWTSTVKGGPLLGTEDILRKAGIH